MWSPKGDPGRIPYSSSFWSHSCFVWRSSPSAILTALRPAATTSSSDGKWDASHAPSRPDKASALPRIYPPGPAPGRRRLSLHPGGSIQAVWGLQQSFRLGHPDLQQYFFRSDLSDALPDWRKDLRRGRGAGHRLDLGAVPVCHLLAGARGLGDESQRLPVEPGPAAYAAHGGCATATASLDRVRVLWGVLAITNTAVLSMLPFCLLYLAWRLPLRSRQFVGFGLCALAAALVVSPWLVRNYDVFGKFVFVRDNLALEIHMANNDQSNGLWTRGEHPGNDPEAMRRFQQLGEIPFMQEKQQQVREFVREHPASFFVLRWSAFSTSGSGLPRPTSSPVMT